MVSAHVKADVKQQEIKELVAVSCNFFKKVPTKLERNLKLAFNFHLILLGIQSNSILFVKKSGGRDG